MNTNTGEIREFLPDELKRQLEKQEELKKAGIAEKGEWVPLTVGEEVSFKGLSFRIHRINPAANQVILVGIPKP